MAYEKDDDIVARAQRNFKACLDWEQDTRQRYREDMRFLFADSDNQDQWEPAVKARRRLNTQPMVTINKTHTHWLHVVNNLKANKPSITVHPTNDEATYEAAQVFEGVVRHIEYISNAKVAYDMAAESQVGGGMGYWLVTTAYADDNSFDQEIYIKEVPDPMSVYLDPHIKKRDGSDAKFGFIYEDMPRAEFQKRYPNTLIPAISPQGNQNWITKDVVRVATYYEVEDKKEWLYALPTEDGGLKYVKQSQLSKEEVKMFNEAIKMGADIERRRIDKKSIKKYLIGGNTVLEKGEWAGKYIPIVRVPGEEMTLEGKLDRKGLVRYMKDAQRAYNYNAAAALEYGALQSKSPYLAPVEAIEGLENYWATANTENHAYLPYNHADEDGNPVPSPVRAPAPSSAPVYMEGMAQAAQELMMTSGQYDQTFGAQSQELSGISIEKRINQGERVTFHFQDMQNMAIQYTGKILIDLIPKIYDTKRIIRILADDGTEHKITVDPELKVAMKKKEEADEGKVEVIFNPNVGTFDVVAEVGPNYDTRREQAFDAMTGILKSQPELASVIGDLYFNSADFPNADKLQERMRNWIAPAILGTGPSQQEIALQQQLQQQQAVIQQLTLALEDQKADDARADKRLEMDAYNHLAKRFEDERKSLIDAFRAETDRLKVLVNDVAPAQMGHITNKLVGEIESSRNPTRDMSPNYAEGSMVLQNEIPDITKGI
jgi:hypothetical protein